MFPSGSQTIDSLLRLHAELHPRHPALSVGRADPASEWISYGELDLRCRQFADYLAQLQIHAGDVVGLLLPNGIEFCIAVLATMRLGAVAMPIQTNSTERELGYMLEHAECHSIVTNSVHAALVGQAVAAGAVLACTIDLTYDGSLHWNCVAALDAEQRPRSSTTAPAPDTAAILLYTSGSTARPKGILLSHEAVINAGLCNAWHQALRPDDRHGIVLPMYHCNALFLQLFAALVVGASVYISRGFDPQRYWSEMCAAGVTMTNLVAAGIRKLLQHDPAPRSGAVRAMLYGMPLFGNELADFESRFHCPLVMVYGLTETAACGTRSPLYLQPRADRIGVPMPGWEVRILDEAGSGCAAETPGEIWLKGPAMFSGYLNDPQESARCLLDGGLLTGDIGYFDSQGYVVFMDRKKDLIKVRGRSVGSLEIETVLREHPLVSDAAVVGVPDQNTDERIIAFVVLKGRFDEAEIREFCTHRLSWYKVPHEFVIRDELPKTSVGKVRKAELKAATTLGTSPPGQRPSSTESTKR